MGYSFRGIAPRHGIGSSVAILAPQGYRHTLTTVPFTVPAGPIIPVGGGGTALQAAIDSSIGETILITDSLNYDPVTIGIVSSANDLTIMADTGQTPTITALPGPFNHCIDFTGLPVNGLAIRGLTLIGSGNASGAGLTDTRKLGSVHNASTDGGVTMQRFIMEDCTFIEPPGTFSDGAPGLMLIGNNTGSSDNVWIHRCTFQDTSALITAPGGFQWGACTIGGYQNVYIQNCKIVRTAAVSGATSTMKGIVVKNLNTIIEDVLCDQIGTNGNPQAFLHAGTPDLGSIVGASAFNNCVAYDCKIGYENFLTGATVNINGVVYDAATVAPGGVAMRRSFGSYNCLNSVITAQGGGIAFTASGVVESYNDVFNFGSTGKVLDLTDQTIDPLYQDSGNRIFTATAPTLQTGASDGGLVGVRYGSGEVIFWVNTPQGT
jgi:hypothetical protein